MDDKQITQLIEKYINNAASEKERAQLLEWYRSYDHSEVVWPESKEELDKRLDNLKDRIDHAIDQDSLKEEPTNVQKLLSLRSLVSAAVILIALSIGAYYLLRPTDSLNSLAVKDTEDSNNILPGGNKASLKLSDGTIYNLTDSAQVYDLYEQNGFTLQVNDGELSFAKKEEKSNFNNNSDIIYNTLSTPRGGQYTVLLPDGSKVWLNAESSLSFPNTFSGNERKVILKGEAYFDIAENKRSPFIVEVDEMKVEVLGTEFNINAYPSEKIISTTLVEGSIKLTKGAKQVVLTPSQKNTWDKEKGSFTTENTDVRSSIAWKNGYFVFNDTDIQTIMTQLSRWYDVEVSYMGDMSDKEYTGRILKRSQIEEVLEMLELTGTIKFKIEGRRIIVMP